jgi:hypothetical protein
MDLDEELGSDRLSTTRTRSPHGARTELPPSLISLSATTAHPLGTFPFLVCMAGGADDTDSSYERYQYGIMKPFSSYP